MKYYIRATNTETNKSMVLTNPTFTNRKKAEEFKEEFEKVMTPVAKLEIIKQK